MKIIKNLKKAIKVLPILILYISYGCTSNNEQKETVYTNLVKQDEFNVNGAVDASLWKADIGTGENGWGNNELQYYTNREKNITVKNGMLYITAIKENYKGAAYTSGKLVTKGLFKQKYGRFEARIKLPWGQGLWPAFWLLGDNIESVRWPQCGEIDIMEYRGQQPNIIHGSIHGPGYSGANPVTSNFILPNGRFDTSFHVFAIEWGADYINYYVDDLLYNQITPADANGTWVFDKPFYIILNLAVGGNFLANPTEQTVFPQTMLVDYVRVYN